MIEKNYEAFFDAITTAFETRRDTMSKALADFDEARGKPGVRWVVAASQHLSREMTQAQAVFEAAIANTAKMF